MTQRARRARGDGTSRARRERSGAAPSPVWRKTSREVKDRIGRALVAVDRECDRRARIDADPIGPVRRYDRRADLELAGLVGACLAFGNARALRAKVSDVFDRLGPNIAGIADDELEVFARLGDWRHRVYRGEDVARLLIGARRVQRQARSLERRFCQALDRHGELREALGEWADAIRSAGGLDRAGARRRGPLHLVPDPRKTSGCKRLLLYLRWMVRPDDGVDLGLWTRVPASLLLIPVDTHIFKLSRNLGLTERRTLSWPLAEEVTAALRDYEPDDPVRFDFSLCHLGMLQRCPSRRDEARCRGCGVQPVCLHWRRPRSRS